MKRIVSFALILLLLLSTVSVLSACRKKNGDEESAAETVAWQDYTVVYNGSAFSYEKDAVNDVIARLTARIGRKAASAKAGSGSGIENDNFEILIGATDRVETETARGCIRGDGWCILPVGRKIVIYGTTSLLTIQAVQTFMQTYLPEGGADSAPTGLQADVHSDVSMVAVTANQRMVYSAKLDSEKGSKYGDEPRTTADNPDAYDYPVVAARQLRATMADACGCREGDIVLSVDTKVVQNHEVAVGITERPITKTLLGQLGNVDKYGFLVQNGQIAVAGYNDVTLRLAVTLFTNCINEAKRTNGNGSVSVLLPEGFSLIKAKTTDNWITDFPQPAYEGLVLTNSADVANNSVEYCYTGTGVTTANYNAYCATLTQNGYALYTENTIEGSIYRTYLNEEKSVTLHVTFAAFSHAAEQKSTLFQPCIRIVSAPVGANPVTRVRLLDQNDFNPEQTYTKITDTRITAMQFDRDVGNWGNAFIITLEDGSFVVLDGGHDQEGSGDYIRLYRVLCDLYYLAHGHNPDQTENRIRLAAWYLSHAHADHAYNFTRFAENYGSRIDAERLIANFASDSETYNSYDPNPTTRDRVSTICGYFKTRMVYYKVHTGWKFYLRNVECEVLYTHEDLVPERIDLFNETSTVIRMTIYNTDGNGNRQGTPTTAIWLGDLHLKGSEFLRATYGNYLKSDMCQVAHHGYRGCETAFYQLVAPTCLWWPGSFDEVTGYMTNGASNLYYRKTDYYLRYELTSVRYIIVNDLQNVTVTITKDGPQFALEDLYNAAENDTNPITEYGDGTKNIRCAIMKIR